MNVDDTYYIKPHLMFHVSLKTYLLHHFSIFYTLHSFSRQHLMLWPCYSFSLFLLLCKISYPLYSTYPRRFEAQLFYNLHYLLQWHFQLFHQESFYIVSSFDFDSIIRNNNICIGNNLKTQ